MAQVQAEINLKFLSNRKVVFCKQAAMCNGQRLTKMQIACGKQKERESLAR
jgi:hypothetical protein